MKELRIGEPVMFLLFFYEIFFQVVTLLVLMFALTVFSFKHFGRAVYDSSQWLLKPQVCSVPYVLIKQQYRTHCKARMVLSICKPIITLK